MVAGLVPDKKKKCPTTAASVLTFHPPGLPSSCGLSRSLLSMCGQDLGHRNDPACVGACCGGIVSKALLKSKITTSVWIPVSLDLKSPMAAVLFVQTDSVKIQLSAGAMVSAHSFSILLGML